MGVFGFSFRRNIIGTDLASNHFGNLFCITTWGESHGKAIGVVIDGCPAGLPLSEEDIQKELVKRRPGANAYTSQRQEQDRCEIYSGTFEGVTTGTPISIIIFNQDQKSQEYDTLKDVYRPGHANFPYLQKYGIFDYRGGGRASGRETAARVAAGAVAKKILALYGIDLTAMLTSVYGIGIEDFPLLCSAKETLKTSPIFCPCPQTESKILSAIESFKESGDSAGGIVKLIIENVPPGIGDPLYEKLEANLAKAMLSIPACKGIEFGVGFKAAGMLGSEHNDCYALEGDEVAPLTNHAGGILAGISTGNPIELNVIFKPPSSIKKPLPTLSLEKEAVSVAIPKEGRHDPVIAIRAVPVVEAMGALVIADALLASRLSQISTHNLSPQESLLLKGQKGEPMHNAT